MKTMQVDPKIHKKWLEGIKMPNTVYVTHLTGTVLTARREVRPEL